MCSCIHFSVKEIFIYYIFLNFLNNISGVGKSSIITRYLKGDYNKDCEATIGASFMYAKVTIRDYQITLKVILCSYFDIIEK